MAEVLVSDVVVPEIFGPYMRQQTEVKNRMVATGGMVLDPILSQRLAGGGLTFNEPSWRDIPNDADNVSSDSGGDSTPNKITADQEVQVRLSRNQGWQAADLAQALAGSDPTAAIGSRVANYWVSRLQEALIATMTGVFADNDANDSGDYTNDISGVFVAGVTDFNSAAFLDAVQTMGDSQEDLGLIMMHSVVYNKAQKNNLITFIRESDNNTQFATFNGRVVVVDDRLPNPSGQVYETWIFGAGAIRWGAGVPRVPVEIDRNALANNGGGDEILQTRVEWIIHPAGHAYAGTSPNGGPSNAATANNLAAAASWNRVWGERKQIKIARLVTTEA